MCTNRSENAKEWIFAMNETLPHDDYTRMFVTTWAIWAARRKVIHEDIYQTPYSTHCFINSYLDEIKILQKTVSSRGPTHPVPRPSCWKPPRSGHVKVNVDAAVLRSGGRVAVAAICRDQAGAFQGASAVGFSNLEDPTTLEILAIREALALADDLYQRRISVASDCKVAVEAINEVEHRTLR